MQASTATIGRFVPDHFAVTSTLLVNRADIAVTGSIAAGSGSLVLLSAVAVRVGDTISIAGAGAAGAAFSSTVQAVSASGKTVTLATNAVTAVTNVPVNVSTFTYMGEPMNASFTLTAQSASNSTTQNYTGTLAKLNPLAAVTAGASGPLGFGMVDGAAPGTPFTVCTATPVNPCFTPSTASGGGFVNGVATGITVPLTVYRGTSPVGPYAALNIGIAPVDSDGVTTIYNLNTTNVVSTTSDHTSIASAGMIYGSMIVSNAHGSELMQLPVKVYLQYWNGLNFAPNSTDNLTTLNVTSVNSGNWNNLTPGNWQKLSVSSTWAAGATSVVPSTASIVFVNGAGNFTLAAPGQGNTGSVDMLIPSVTGTNCLVASVPLGCYLPSNTARTTFGVYKGPSEFIYLRENY
jgi:MSHA biogenesis protein MshQ